MLKEKREKKEESKEQKQKKRRKLKPKDAKQVTKERQIKSPVKNHIISINKLMRKPKRKLTKKHTSQ